MKSTVLSPTMIQHLNYVPLENMYLLLSKLLSMTFQVDSESIIKTECIEEAGWLNNPQLIQPAVISMFMNKPHIIRETVRVKKRRKEEYQKLLSEFTIADDNCNCILAADISSINLLPFLNNENYSKVKTIEEILGALTLEERIELQPGEEFDIQKTIIDRYIKKSKALIVRDRYIQSKNAEKNLDMLLTSLSPNAKVRIHTLNNVMNENTVVALQRNHSRLQIETEWFQDEFNNTNHKSKSSLHSRSIETESFKIDLGSSLDFTYFDKSDGKVRIKTEIVISVFKKLQNCSK